MSVCRTPYTAQHTAGTPIRCHRLPAHSGCQSSVGRVCLLLDKLRVWRWCRELCHLYKQDQDPQPTLLKLQDRFQPTCLTFVQDTDGIESVGCADIPVACWARLQMHFWPEISLFVFQGCSLMSLPVWCVPYLWGLPHNTWITWVWRHNSCLVLVILGQKHVIGLGRKILASISFN